MRRRTRRYQSRATQRAMPSILTSKYRGIIISLLHRDIIIVLLYVRWLVGRVLPAPLQRYNAIDALLLSALLKSLVARENCNREKTRNKRL